MASFDQLVSFVQNANANVANLTQTLIGGAFFPRIAGGTLGFSLGTASGALLTLSTTQQVTFVNISSTATAYVCPAFDLNNKALAAGPSGGNYVIKPLGALTMVAQAGSWLAAASATATPFTVGLGLGR